jgi:CDP-diacylglycerol---glycerol-3-phosphate 3-phosphatidyltransferase
MAWLEKRKGKRRRLTKQELMGLPNFITYARIAAVPFFVIILSTLLPADFVPRRWDIFWSWFIPASFIIISLTDVVDGYLARREGLTSTYGKFLDPLADKLLSGTLLIMLIPLQRVQAWLVVALISREIIVTGVRAMAADEGFVMAASTWGKRKSAIMSCGIAALLIHYPFWGINPQVIGTVCLWLSLLISFGSGVHYVLTFFKAVLAKQRSS